MGGRAVREGRWRRGHLSGGLEGVRLEPFQDLREESSDEGAGRAKVLRQEGKGYVSGTGGQVSLGHMQGKDSRR